VVRYDGSMRAIAVGFVLATLVSACAFRDGSGFGQIDDDLPIEQISFVGTLDSVDVQGTGLPRSLPIGGNHLGGPNGPATIGPGEVRLTDGRSLPIVSATAGTDCASIGISTPAVCTVLGQLTGQNVEWILLTPDLNMTVEIDGEELRLLRFGGSLVDTNGGNAFVDAREVTLTAEIDPSAILVDCRGTGSLDSKDDVPDAAALTAW